MIPWFILFLIIIGISFILAYLSMKNYQENPQRLNDEYGLFLIRRINNFNEEFLNSIRSHMLNGWVTFSIERLFKGRQTALAVSGPKKILHSFTEQLDLLELEDYSIDLDPKDISAWEVGVNLSKPLGEDLKNIFQNLTELGEQDQFFWQIILGADKGEKKPVFKTQIRAVVYSKDPDRRKKLASMLQDLSLFGLIKIPRPFLNEQLMDFFKARNLHRDTGGPVLNSTGVINLLKV